MELIASPERRNIRKSGAVSARLVASYRRFRGVLVQNATGKHDLKAGEWWRSRDLTSTDGPCSRALLGSCCADCFSLSSVVKMRPAICVDSQQHETAQSGKEAIFLACAEVLVKLGIRIEY